MPALSADVLYIKEIQVTMNATKAANKKYFTKQDTLKATDDVAAALNKVDDSETASKPVQKTIQKESERADTKEVKKAMVKEQLKDLSSAKMAENSGRNSNKNSKEKKNKSQKKSINHLSKTSESKKIHTPGKGKQKKGNKHVTFNKKKTQSTPNPRNSRSDSNTEDNHGGR